MTITKTTSHNILQNYYWMEATAFYFLLIVGPILFSILPTYYYFSHIMGIESLFLYIFIPIFIVVGVFIIKPAIKDSKYRLIGTFWHHTINQISLYVKDVLQENNVEFSTTTSYRRKKEPREYYDISYIAKQNGLEIGLAKGSSNTKATFVSIRYLTTTSKTTLELIKNGIEKRANESGNIL
jgi:hypothetical protein